MDVRKTIAELTSQLSEINYDSEEENILSKDINTDDYVQSSTEENEYEEVEPSKLRKATDSINLPEQVYGGKTTTRKKTYLQSDFSDNEYLKDTSNHSSSGDEENDEIESDEAEIESEEAENESEESENKSEAEEENISDEGESKAMSSKPCKNKDGTVVHFDIYSTGSKNIPSDLKKGTAIRNQIKIWENLLECRIKLQKALCACNNLPAKEEELQLDSENKLKLNKCKKNLVHLIDKMIELQTEMLKQCHEFKRNKDLKFNELDEEIQSEESEFEGEDEIENENEPIRKKRKLNEYSSLIKDNHNKLIPFRNSSIQKWNDKTKVSTGKMANSNFSAFDRSTLKQIEQIMADKIRLINRTRIKRNYHQDSSTKNQADLSQASQETNLDAEVFDDTDFYHKLLRDYIERKSSDVTNSSHTERQMIELQKLRSKMKKNVDTKSTKGRKLRYVVLPKLVNFMAPDPYNIWSEEAETELYHSLFGKIKGK